MTSARSRFTAPHLRTLWWGVLGFSLVLLLVASGILATPAIDHGVATVKVPVHHVLTRHEWVDCVVIAISAAVAVICASALAVTSRRARVAADEQLTPVQ